MQRPEVAIVGAGQLARMTCQAAVALDVGVHLLAGSPDECAVPYATRTTIGSPAGRVLAAFAAAGDVLTFEHEHVPVGELRELAARGRTIRPGVTTLRAATDKGIQREEFAAAGLPVPPFALVEDHAALEAFGAEHRWPLIAKLPSGGYDGKGVFELADAAAGRSLLDEVRRPLLLEPRLDLDLELAVVVARRPGGEHAVYPVTQTVQRDGICHEVLVPAPVPARLADAAADLALRVAEQVDAVGILAVELFVVAEELLVNEIAARPHNSGHFSIEGAVTSQFENHLRAVLDWPLGSTQLRAPAVVMRNVLGPADGSDPRARLADALAVPEARVHLYGKAAKPGRKLGHVTVLGDDLDVTRDQAARAVRALTGAPLVG